MEGTCFDFLVVANILIPVFTLAFIVLITLYLDRADSIHKLKEEAKINKATLQIKDKKLKEREELLKRLYKSYACFTLTKTNLCIRLESVNVPCTLYETKEALERKTLEYLRSAFSHGDFGKLHWMNDVRAYQDYFSWWKEENQSVLKKSAFLDFLDLVLS